MPIYEELWKLVKSERTWCPCHKFKGKWIIQIVGEIEGDFFFMHREIKGEIKPR